MRNKTQIQAGFSLLELLIVLMIIGVIIGGLTFSVNPRDKDCETEARRFYNLVEMARDEAILRSEEYAITFSQGKYIFVKFTQGSWHPLSQTDVFRSRIMPEAIGLEIILDGERVNIQKDDTNSSTDDQSPHVYLYSSGEFTPFSVIFNDLLSGIQYQVVGDHYEGIQLRPYNKDN